MGIAMSLQQYLDDNDIKYDVTTHKYTSSSSSTAEAGHVSGDCLAKGVVVKRGDGYVLAILPASRQVSLDRLADLLERPVELASEDEISDLFHDCDKGAVPPVGAAYGLRACVDESLEGMKDVYLEGGDHRTLVHLSRTQFRRLMEEVPHGRFAA